LRFWNNDGFVKGSSAALRFNFVVAAPKGPHFSIFARLAAGAFYEGIVPLVFARSSIMMLHSLI
jgi:hypothetical protein